MARGLINRHGEESVAISLVALGEAIIVLRNKLDEEEISPTKFQRAMDKLSDYLIRGELGLCGWGSTVDRLRRVLTEIRDADDHLEPSDTMIVAGALLCEHCQHLYTSDKVLIESEGVQRLFHTHHKGIGEAPTRGRSRGRRMARYGGRR